MGAARYFDEARDDGGVLPGVPKRDLEEEEFATYPAWLQASIDQSPAYRKSRVRTHEAPDKKDGE